VVQISSLFRLSYEGRQKARFTQPSFYSLVTFICTAFDTQSPKGAACYSRVAEAGIGCAELPGILVVTMPVNKCVGRHLRWLMAVPIGASASSSVGSVDLGWHICTVGPVSLIVYYIFQ